MLPQASDEHLSGYSRRDWQIVDYEMYLLKPTQLWFRGPKPVALDAGRFIACVGAAQTFGCFCDLPFSSLLSQQLGMPTLNLGYGGAGPAFFARQPELLRWINRAALVIIQIMSGRSESNTRFASSGLELLHRRSDGTAIGADAAYRGLLREYALLNVQLPSNREFFLFPSKPLELAAIIEETRTNWVNSSRNLLQAITAPTILFYFSKRKPDYHQRFWSVNTLFGGFPQLVNGVMIDELRPLVEATVECVSSRGSPQPLKNRFSGRPVTIDLSLDRPDLTGTWRRNAYYPSPQMHRDAAAALVPVCRRLMSL